MAKRSTKNKRVLSIINKFMPRHSGGINSDRYGNNSNDLVYPQAEDSLDRFKYEIANNLGIDLGPETSARANGTVGGLMVKNMVRYAQKNIDDVDVYYDDVEF